MQAIDVIKRRLKALHADLEEDLERPIEARFLVDTARVVERAVAARAGLGWYGKHACLIVPGHGSWMLLGELLLDLDLEPVLDSLGRTGSLVTLEEGTLTGGVGAEIAARVQAEAWSELSGPITRVATRDGIVPSARSLEDEALPSAEDVVAAVTARDRVGG